MITTKQSFENMQDSVRRALWEDRLISVEILREQFLEKLHKLDAMDAAAQVLAESSPEQIKELYESVCDSDGD